MQVQAVVTQANGIISMRIQCTFVGDPTDANDKALIAAFGDPEVNIGGTFQDPRNIVVGTFQFPTTQNFVGITTELMSQTARFMLALPQAVNPNQPAPVQGPMDCITTNPSGAAQAWFYYVLAEIQQAMAALRAQTLVPTIPTQTV